MLLNCSPHPPGQARRPFCGKAVGGLCVVVSNVAGQRSIWRRLRARARREPNTGSDIASPVIVKTDGRSKGFIRVEARLCAARCVVVCVCAAPGGWCAGAGRYVGRVSGLEGYAEDILRRGRRGGAAHRLAWRGGGVIASQEVSGRAARRPGARVRGWFVIPAPCRTGRRDETRGPHYPSPRGGARAAGHDSLRGRTQAAQRDLRATVA